MDTKKQAGKFLNGTALSSAKNKTVVIKVDRYFKHPLYKKYINVSKKYLVHDPEEKVKEGDRVTIVETKPVSKRKRFKVADSSDQ